MPAAGQTVVFVHGAWVTPASWDTFRQPFEAAGYTVLTPSWPLLEGRTAADLRAEPPPGLGGLTIGAIADHLQAFIETLDAPALLVGHSFGGLLVQLLMDRGLGRAGIALNPVPIGGFVPGPVTLTAALPAVARWNGWNRTYSLSPELYARRYANAAPPALQAATYEAFVIPTPGRIFYQAASWIGTMVDPHRRKAPLLITAGDADRLVTPYVSRAAFRIQSRSGARTDFTMFPGRSHLLIAEPGWEAVAAESLAWAAAL
ncbi:MAG: hypothetical protein JWO33_2910 [Caulobacteraceae bacterium]|nr:hypothetical protein [Caulobacteraceae bacterium]